MLRKCFGKLNCAGNSLNFSFYSSSDVDIWKWSSVRIPWDKYHAPVSLMLIPSNMPTSHSLPFLATLLGSASLFAIPFEGGQAAQTAGPQPVHCCAGSTWYLPVSQCHLLLMHLPLLHMNWVSGSQVGNSVKGNMRNVSWIELDLYYIQFTSVIRTLIL